MFFRLMFTFLSLATVAPLVAPQWVGNPLLEIMGLPVSYTLSFAPIFLAVLLLVLLAIKLARVHWFLPFPAAAGVLVILWCMSIVFNNAMDRRAAELVAGDMKDFIRPPMVRTLAVSRSSEAQCDDFCQRMLLNNQVERLLYAKDADSAPVVTDVAATSFRMEKRDSCPAVDLVNEVIDGMRASEKRNGKEQLPGDLMRRAISGGRCLIVERSTLGDADVVLFRRTVMNGPTSTLAAAFGLRADLVRGDRLSMHQRDGAAFREVYRRTIVMVDKVSSFSPSSLSSVNFLRPTILQRVVQQYSGGPEWNTFVTVMLGFDLVLK